MSSLGWRLLDSGAFSCTGAVGPREGAQVGMGDPCFVGPRHRTVPQLSPFPHSSPGLPATCWRPLRVLSQLVLQRAQLRSNSKLSMVISGNSSGSPLHGAPWGFCTAPTLLSSPPYKPILSPRHSPGVTVPPVWSPRASTY